MNEQMPLLRLTDAHTQHAAAHAYKAAANTNMLAQPAPALDATEKQRWKTHWSVVSRVLKELVAAQLDKERPINLQDPSKLAEIHQRLAKQFGDQIPSLRRPDGQAVLKEKIRNLMNNKRSQETREAKERQLRAKLGDHQYKRLTPYQFAEGLYT